LPPLAEKFAVCPTDTFCDAGKHESEPEVLLF
jgi:hypothetical protein